MNSDPYKAPTADIELNHGAQAKPGMLLVIITVLIIIVNLFFSYILASIRYPGNSAGLIGYIIGQVFVLPIIMVGLFQIGKRFRNARSRTKIFFWTSFVIFISHIGNMITLVRVINQS